MDSKTQIRFEFGLKQFLNQDGALEVELPPKFNTDLLRSMYQWMVKTRLFDAKAIAMQRTGQLGTYASSLGQEAYSVAMGLAMRREDCLAPYYRDHAAQLIRGVSEAEILQFWGGSEQGSNFKHAPQHDFTSCIPIATQVTHAAGAAMAFQIKNEKRVAVTSCGDGATSRGDFYESINFAGVRSLPLVIYVNNNQWAISVPIKQQTACETIAQKAIAAQIRSLRVDGNDVIAIYSVMQEALELARSGGGATLIEGVSYRLCDHTTADDADRYRDKNELQEAWARCPIHRLKKYLIDKGDWSEQDEEELVASYRIHLEHQVNHYLQDPGEEPSAIFDYLYADLPYSYLNQKQHLVRRC